MTTTTAVKCPGIVCREQEACTAVVDATYGPKTVSVSACPSLIEQGWTGPAVVFWHNQAVERLVPAATATVVQHRDGLVTFA